MWYLIFFSKYINFVLCFGWFLRFEQKHTGIKLILMVALKSLGILIRSLCIIVCNKVFYNKIDLICTLLIKIEDCIHEYWIASGLLLETWETKWNVFIGALCTHVLNEMRATETSPGTNLLIIKMYSVTKIYLVCKYYIVCMWFYHVTECLLSLCGKQLKCWIICVKRQQKLCKFVLDHNVSHFSSPDFNINLLLVYMFLRDCLSEDYATF